MNIYFAGLGGIGIGPLALLSRDMGYQVFGSDKAPSRYTDLLASEGIDVNADQTGKYLRETAEQSTLDWYVHTAAMPDDHPELIMARQLGIKHIAKRDELINFILKEHDLKLVAVSGTHGKTTTTAMLVWLFDQLKAPFAHIVGTNLSFAPSGRYQKGAEYLIYEADEFDRNMLRFHPFCSVITALDYDHSDTYAGIDDYKAAFRQFVEQSEQCVLSSVGKKYLELPDSSKLLVVENAPKVITLPGDHNRRNALLALEATAKLLDKDTDELSALINSYPGSERRFERIAENLYSDYAHHPAEIRATLQLAREVAGDKKIVAVYQPHQNTRQHEIIDQYQDCFSGADRLYWLPTYLSRENESLPVLPPAELLSRLTKAPEGSVADLNDELAENIKKHLSNGDVVLVMGAGSVDDWLRNEFAS